MPNRSRKSAVEWERTHRKTVGTQLSIEEAETVRRYAEAHGETTSSLIKRLLREQIHLPQAEQAEMVDSPSKICPICGKEFCGNNQTCSNECFRARRRQIAASEKGVRKWSDSKRAAHSERCKASAEAVNKMLSAKAASMQSPINQKGSQNCRCKLYVLMSPEGETYFVEGLLPWARDHCSLFFDDLEIAEIGIDKAAARIASAFSSVASNSPTLKSVTSYKGWIVLQKTDKPKEVTE